MSDSGFDAQEGEGDNNYYRELLEHHDENHVPIWILAIVGVFVAILIVLPNIWSAKRADKIE